MAKFVNVDLLHIDMNLDAAIPDVIAADCSGKGQRLRAAYVSVRDRVGTRVSAAEEVDESELVDLGAVNRDLDVADTVHEALAETKVLDDDVATDADGAEGDGVHGVVRPVPEMK